MARHGISYDDVTTAISTLKGQGKNITIENVRGCLGTGSASTINLHLRRWREIQNTTQKIATKENLPEPLVALITGLWEGLIRESTERFTPLEANYQQEITELKKDVEKYRNNNQRWQKLFNQWQQEKTILANEKLTLEQAIEYGHKENQSLRDKSDGLSQQLRDKQERVEELHRLHQQGQANLEHYRESSREQRLLDQQQFERAKQQYQIEAKELKDQLIMQQVKYSDLSQENTLTKQSNKELEKEKNKFASISESLVEKVKDFEKAIVEYQQTSLHWHNQSKELQASLEKKFTEAIAMQSENKLLNQKLLDTKHLLQQTRDQNKLLAQDKWELAQEKAELVGKVKQMLNESVS